MLMILRVFVSMMAVILMLSAVGGLIGNGQSMLAVTLVVNAGVITWWWYMRDRLKAAAKLSAEITAQRGTAGLSSMS